MDTSHLVIFTVAYLAVLVMPGPGVTALVARVLARGGRGAPSFIAGFVAGSVTWLAIAVTGLAALATTFSRLFLAIRYGGAVYLLFLAWKFWTASPSSQAAADASPDGGVRLFLAGLAINLGNPKVIVFFLALLPTVVEIGTLTPLGFAELVLIVIAVASSVLTGYALLAVRARRLFTTPRALRLVNRGSSVVMAGTAISIAAR
jgi:threonine/homoserine/homoserine lactone efflux protein